MDSLTDNEPLNIEVPYKQKSITDFFAKDLQGPIGTEPIHVNSGFNQNFQERNKP